jgi:hypothetical protein
VEADYALYWRERDLYELKGNVIVEGDKGQKLYTQQLNWDVKLKKIYSHVDSKVEEADGVMTVVGFEAADDFSWWKGAQVSGTTMISTEPGTESGTEPGAESGAATGAATGAESGAATGTKPADKLTESP